MSREFVWLHPKSERPNCRFSWSVVVDNLATRCGLRNAKQQIPRKRFTTENQKLSRTNVLLTRSRQQGTKMRRHNFQNVYRMFREVLRKCCAFHCHLIIDQVQAAAGNQRGKDARVAEIGGDRRD